MSDDPRRWITLGIVLMSTLIVVLDNTVLNVAIPTILREFHTTVPTLEWVITGYALTFATLLIIGGRLGDLYGTDDVPAYAAAARADDLSRLPPTLVISGGADGFRDENILYAMRLGQAGVPTDLIVIAGAPHGVQTLFAGTRPARRWARAVREWLQPRVETPR